MSEGWRKVREGVRCAGRGLLLRRSSLQGNWVLQGLRVELLRVGGMVADGGAGVAELGVERLVERVMRREGARELVQRRGEGELLPIRRWGERVLEEDVGPGVVVRRER